MLVQLRLRAFIALALLVAACDIIDPSGAGRNDFPDAGPGGPDSTFAGVGQGIPFGEVEAAEAEFGRPYSGALVGTTRGTIAGLLRQAQTRKTRLLLKLASKRDYTNSDGTFNLDLWKRQIDQYRDVNFAPYVTEGLVLAHRLVDEPTWPVNWGGHPIPLADIEEMARYSKSIWPTLPTAISGDSRPELLQGFDWHYLDIASAQWSGPVFSSRAQTVEEFRNENVARAKELGLGLIFSVNVLDGGDGSSGIRGPRYWEMTGAELQGSAVTLAQTPYACAFYIWRHDAGFEGRPDVHAAIDTIAAAAAARGGTSCVRHPIATDTLPTDTIPADTVPTDTVPSGSTPPTDTTGTDTTGTDTTGVTDAIVTGHLFKVGEGSETEPPVTVHDVL